MKWEQEQWDFLCRLYLDTAQIQMSIKQTSELNNAANNFCAVTGKIAGVRTLKYAKNCYVL